MSGLLASVFEKRFHVSQEPPGWVEKFFGWQVHSGVKVNQDSALEFSAVFACIRNLAEDVAKLPLMMYERTGAKSRSPAPTHFLHLVLHDIANSEMTAYTLRETMMQHLLSWGNAYAEIEFNKSGETVGLWPLNTAKVKPFRDRSKSLKYEVTMPSSVGSTRVLPASRVFHLHGMGSNGYMGFSPIRMARQTIGLGMAAEKFGSRFFGNDARPGVVLEEDLLLVRDVRTSPLAPLLEGKGNLSPVLLGVNHHAMVVKEVEDEKSETG